MVKGKLISMYDLDNNSYDKDCKEVFKIRKSVFKDELRESKEEFNIHVLVKNDNENYVATGTITYTMDKYFISKVAVLEEERNKKYGDFVVRMLVNKAFMSGAKEVELSCKKDIAGFFETIGFEKIDESEEMFHMKLIFSNFKTACGHNCMR